MTRSRLQAAGLGALLGLLAAIGASVILWPQAHRPSQPVRWLVVADSEPGQFLRVAVPQSGRMSSERFSIAGHGSLRTNALAFCPDGMVSSLGSANGFKHAIRDFHLLIDRRFEPIPLLGSAEQVRGASESRYANQIAATEDGIVLMSSDCLLVLSGDQPRRVPVEDPDPERGLVAAGQLVAVITRTKQLIIVDTHTQSLTRLPGQHDGMLLGMTADSVFIGQMGSQDAIEISLKDGHQVDRLRHRHHGAITQVFSAFDSLVIVEVPDIGNQTVIYDREGHLRPLRLRETRAFDAAMAPSGWQPE